MVEMHQPHAVRFSTNFRTLRKYVSGKRSMSIVLAISDERVTNLAVARDNSSIIEDWQVIYVKI